MYPSSVYGAGYFTINHIDKFRDCSRGLNQFANGLDDRGYATKIMNAAVATIKGIEGKKKDDNL